MESLKGILIIVLAAIVAIACYAAGMILGWLTGILAFILMILGGIGCLIGLTFMAIKEYLEYRQLQAEADEDEDRR
jgi:fatty acid desaturase